MAASLPIIAGESGLARYLQEIKRFPMLEPQEEYMLAKRCANTMIGKPPTSSSPATFALSPRSAWAIAEPRNKGESRD